MEKMTREQIVDVLNNYYDNAMCDQCEFQHDCEDGLNFSIITNEELKEYAESISGKIIDIESQNECELIGKKMEQVKVLKKLTKIFYPNTMKDVLPLKEFVKSITDKGYKVELTKDNVVSDTVVNIYKEVEMKE